MFSDLERCNRCHQRYPEPLGHRCPQASFAEQRERDFERKLEAWLRTPEDRFRFVK